MYIYGLGPEPNYNLESYAPKIETYIHYLIKPNDDNKDNARAVNQLLHDQTLRMGVFRKCSFSKVQTMTWNVDIKFMLPIVVITWLRQLQQYFLEEDKRTWSKLGNYNTHVTLNKGESRNPLGIVYVKSSDEQMYEVKNYSDIKLDETYKRNK